MPPDRSLPIFDLEVDLAAALSQSNARVVVEAPTGSGKSTQIPQFLHDSKLCGDGEIYVLQPRRIAARMLARRAIWRIGKMSKRAMIGARMAAPSILFAWRASTR